MKTSFLAFVAILVTSQVHAKNLHVVDPEKTSIKKITQEVASNIKDGKPPGFRMLRTGKPKFAGFQEMCKLGVRRMVVMAGNGSIEEEFAKTPWGQKECPGFKVIYNQTQSTPTPLNRKFLEKFDEAVDEAKASGVGVAFRCNCGCHRTGRLAAYYRLKEMKKSAGNSLKDQRKSAGIASFLYRRMMKFQIQGLEDFVNKVPCRFKGEDATKYCVREDDTTPAWGSESTSALPLVDNAAEDDPEEDEDETDSREAVEAYNGSGPKELPTVVNEESKKVKSKQE
jgi:hypothetical protein